MKKFIPLLIFTLVIFFAYKAFAFFIDPAEDSLNFSAAEKIVAVNNNGLFYEAATHAETVADFLRENKISLGEKDQIIPEKNTRLTNGSSLSIKKAVKIRFAVDGKTLEAYTLQSTVGDAASENNLKIGRLDLVSPDEKSLPRENMLITITRINIEEKTIAEDIDFKTIAKNDPKLSWREQKVEQAGEKGIRETKYRATYKNGKEVSRVALEKTITKEPTPKIVVQGTLVKTGKEHRGLGTWYAFKGGLFAANPWLPMGSYVKVTNLGNGKSVIVQINDRGPFGPGRIIDLDKVAFQKIASLGAGVVNVKVEEITN